MHSQPHETPTPTAAQPTAWTCSCEHPLPRQRAERKGAAATYCERCGLPVPVGRR
ncbi:MAG: hypothetical protein QOE36_3452 [Gaiellaceae bacterium]|jgi:hypothetical protein|nr:hypothetical protein [Gaiellaceae bacterium]